MQILVVDDARAVHAFITHALKDTQHALVHVYDGNEALTAVHRSMQLFDLILLDWEMPGLDGPSTLTVMRREGINIPIVMVTTKCDMSSIIEALDRGANDYVMKPFTKDILLEKIEAVCGAGAK